MQAETLFAVVLAAGESSRFGSAKQLATYQGQPLVTRAIRLAETVCAERTVLVTGNAWQKVAAACAPLAGFIVCNSEFRAGMASSIAAGVGAVRAAAGAVLLILADQPLVTTGHLANLAEAWRETPGMIVASGYAGTNGPPVIFPRAFFPELMSLGGDRGAKTVIACHRECLRVIAFDPAATDIDRPSDLKNL